MTTKNIEDVVAELVEEFDHLTYPPLNDNDTTDQYRIEAHDRQCKWFSETLTKLVKEAAAEERGGNDGRDGRNQCTDCYKDTGPNPNNAKGGRNLSFMEKHENEAVAELHRFQDINIKDGKYHIDVEWLDAWVERTFNQRREEAE